MKVYKEKMHTRINWYNKLMINYRLKIKTILIIYIKKINPFKIE